MSLRLRSPDYVGVDFDELSRVAACPETLLFGALRLPILGKT